MTEENELLSCPFCGCRKSTIYNFGTLFADDGIRMMCSKRGASSGWGVNQSEAEKKWNTRSQENTLQETQLDIAKDIIAELLDGPDANNDERCGLSSKQWGRRVSNARKFLNPKSKIYDLLD